MAGMFDDLVPGGSKPKAEQKTESGPWDTYKPQGQNEDGPWSAYQGGAFDDLVPATKPKRNLFARANDTVIEAGNAAAGLAKAGIDLFAPDSSVSESIGQFIQSGQDKQSDWKKDQRQRLNSELASADGELDKAGIYARHALIEDPLGTVGQVAGNIGPFGIAGKAMQGLSAAQKTAGAMGLAGGVSAGEVRGNIYDKISNTSDADLVASSPEYAALRQSGVSEQEAKSRVGASFLKNAPEIAVAGAIGSLGGKYGLEGVVTGAGKSFGRLGNAAIGVIDEGSQGAVEQLASNVGAKRVLPNQSLTEDVAMNAVAEGIMGLGGAAVGKRRQDKPATDQAADATSAEPSAPPAPTYTGTPNDQTMAAEVERANQVAAAQANADAIYAERAAFEQERAPAKLPVTGPLSAAVNVGIDSGATSITSPANPRYEIPAQPRGSFSQQDELASLIGQERADVADRRELAQLVGQERRDQERRIAEAADSRRALDAALADTDRRAAGVAAQESEAARLRLLDNILSSVSDTGNPARQFGNALRRAGYRNTDFTERERQVIQRFSDARAALRSPEATTVPAAPNELDAASLGIRERSTARSTQAASGRDKIGEAVSLLSQGWKLALNKTLVSPTGKKRKLNAEEFAAVREARAKMINKTEAGNAATQVDAVSDQGRGDVAAGGVRNAQPVRSIARGRGGNAGAPVPGMRAAGAVGNAGGAGSALNAAQPEQVAQEAAQANGTQAAPAGDQIAIKSASHSAATIPAKTPAENQSRIKNAEAAPAGAQQQQKEPKNGMQEGRRQEEVAAQTPAVTTPPAESFGLVEPVKDLSEASRQALYESLKDRLTKGEITLQYGQRQMAAFDEAVKAEEEANSGAQEAKRDQSKPEDVSKIPQKTNTSGESVKKTAENEQVESADKLDPAKIRAGYAHRSLGGLGDKVKLEQMWFDKASEAFAEKVGEKAESEEQKALAAKLLDDFKAEYKTRRYRVMRVGETVVSSAVAGRNKFNAAQAGRRGSALDRAEQEFTDWQKGAIESGVRAIRAARSPEQIAAEQQAKADKAAKKKADLHALLGKLLDFKKGDDTLFGKYPVARVSLDKSGYPSSVTVDATDLTDNKFDIARILFDGDKEKLRAAVDEIRASRTVAEEPPSDSGPLSLVDQHNADIAKLFDGELSVDELKAAFAMVRDNRAAIEAELSKFKKDELLRSGGPMFGARYKSETKPEIVKAAYAAMLDNFIMGESISYALGGGVDWVTTKVKALQARVDAATPESLAAYAAKIKANRAEREQRRDEVAKSIADPKTLEDFRRLMQSKVDSGKTVEEARFELTPEQRARFDMLLAEESRGRRSASAEASKTDVRAAAQTTTGDIIETKHTKTGVPLFVVKAAERVDRDIYNEWNANAKRLGGWYSSFRGNGAVPGFQFKTRENAAAFLQYLGGDTTAAKEAIAERRDAFADDRSQSAVERLNEMADRLEERADESLGRERKANTARRARFAASAEAAANSDKALASTMRNIADAISAGTTKFLDRVRQKTQVEMLRSTVRTAQYSELQKKYPSYADQEKRRGEKPTAETADYARWPTFTADRSDLARLGRDLLQIDGAKQLGQRILKVADDVTDAYQKFAKENLHKVSVFSAKREGSDEKHMAVFPTADKAEAAIARSGFKGKATTVSFKRGEHLVIMGPEMAREAGLWQGDPDKRITLNAEAGEEIVAKVKALGKGKVTMPHVFESVAAERARWKALGIETPAEFRSALREFIALQESPVAPDRIKQMERAMIGRANDGLDFFPTPAETAKAMIEAAEISEGMAVLEPSAGMGHIAEQIRDVAGVDPDVVEFNGDRRELLEAKGFNVVGSDFLDLSPRGFTYGDVFRDKDGVEGIMRGSGGMGSNRVGFVPLGKDERQREWRDRDELEGVRKSGYNSGYDRIIMNPPFSNRRDAEHVQHAYSLLKPGGRLVAIMGEGVFYGQDRKAQAFREWLEAVGGTSEKLEEGTFLDPSLPVNTGVNARMVVVDKPENRETTSGSTGQNFESRSPSPADAEFSATERAYGGREAFDRAKAAGKTKLNYRQWVQVRTPKFKEWFGDWEAPLANDSVSKAVDPETGEPLVVYHGTDKIISKTSKSKPFFVTENAELASWFAKSRKNPGSVMPLYVAARNPFDYENEAHANLILERLGIDIGEGYGAKTKSELMDGDFVFIESDQVQQAIRSSGFDSFYAKEDTEKTLALYKSEQIKSATGNNGNFDGGNPDVRESRVDGDLFSGIAATVLQDEVFDGAGSSPNGTGNFGVTRTVGPHGERLISIPVDLLRTTNGDPSGSKSGIQVGRIGADNTGNRSQRDARSVNIDRLIDIVRYLPSAVPSPWRSDAAALESKPNGRPMQASHGISDLLIGGPLLSHLKRLIDVPGQRLSVMKPGVIFGGQNFKIVDGVIQSIPVDMMNVFVSGKTAAGVSFHNQPVFILPSDSLIENVALLDDISSALRPSYASGFGHSTPSHKNTLKVRRYNDLVKKFKDLYAGASALDIRVVATREEIPDRYRPSIYAEGVYHQETGLVYLVASNVDSDNRLMQILMHEAIGHYGLANMMGSQFSSLLETVLKRAVSSQPLNRNPQPGEANYETVDAVRRLYPEASDTEVAQEVLARMAETMPNVGWFRMAMARIRVWLKNAAKAFGLKLEPTMADVRRLVELAGYHVRSGANLERSPAGQDAVFASQREAVQSKIPAMDDYQKRADQLDRAFTAMGLVSRRESSRVSQSEYVEVQDPNDESKTYKIRVSNHQLPSGYKQPDFDVIANEGRHGGHDWNKAGTWVEAVEWLAGKIGVPVPATVKSVRSLEKTNAKNAADRDAIKAVRFAEQNLAKFETSVSSGAASARKSGSGEWIVVPGSGLPISLGKHPGVAFSLDAAIEMARDKLRSYVIERQEKAGIAPTPDSAKLGFNAPVDAGMQERTVRAVNPGSSEPAQSNSGAGSNDNVQQPGSIRNGFESRSATIGRNESIIDQMRNAGRRMAGSPALDESDPFAAENARLREQDKSLWTKAKTQLRRYLSPGGLLPQSVFAEKIKRDSEFQAVEFDIRHLIGGLERAAKSDFGVSFDKLSDAQMSQISEALAGSVPASLPDATKAAAVAMRQYIDGMSSEYLKIIQDKIDAKMDRAIETGKASDAAQAINDIELYEKIKGNIGRYVHRSYQAFDDPKWFEKVPTSVLNSARAYLKKGYVDSGETDAKAAQLSEVTLHEILKNGTAYDSMEAFIAESKLGAKDLSILMRRKDVPAEIRALLGEYSDARLNFTKSATKMGRLIWNTRFLDRVRDIGMGSFFFEGKDRPPAATTQIAAEGSEVYSPLNGLWTFPEIAQAFKDAMGKEQMSELYRAIVRANGIVKYGKTVLSPTTAMRNWQSAMFFSLANGHFDLTQMKKSIAAFREQVSQKATGNDLKYLRHLKQLGVVYDTPYAGEMARLLEDAKMEELLSSGSGDAVRLFRKANQIAQGFYAFGDDFWKIIGFENEKSGLMKAGLSLQDAELEAAKRIRDTYPTYSMVGRGVQWLSRFPLAGTFVSFPAEIIRTSSNMLRTVASDLKSDNPKLRELGMRRAAGMAFVSAAFWALSALSKAMVGVDDDEEEAIRDLAPEWQKNSTFLFTGRDEKGNLRYFDMSFLDPYGYWKRPITAMMRNQPWEESLASGLRGMLEPFLGADITAGAIFEAVANQKQSGGKVYKENDGAIDQAVDIADHLRKALQPGFVGNIERITKAAADVRKPSGQPYSMEDELVALGGWRATTVEPKTALYYRSFEFTDAIAEARKTLSDTLRDANSVSEIDIEDAKSRAAAKQEKAFVQMRRLIGAAESAGLSKMQIMQTLRLSNVSQQNIAALMQGRVPPVVVTPQMRIAAVSQARTMRGEEFANEVSDRYRMAMGL